MSQTERSTGLQHKLLAPFVGAMLVFALVLHFLWLPAGLSEVRAEFQKSQRSMLSVLQPALTGLLLSEDLVQIHAILKQTERDVPQWVSIRLDDPQGRRLYPLETRAQPSAPESIVLETSLAYQQTALGHLTVVTDPTDVLQAETRKIRLLEVGFLVAVLVTAAFFLWLQNRLIVRPLQKLADVANRLADDDFTTELPEPSNDEVGHLIRAFGAMRTKRKETETQLLGATEHSQQAQRQAEEFRNLLYEAVNNIAQGFTIYGKDDELILCNEAYLSIYETSRDLIVPGATFEEIVRKGAERGQYEAALGRVDEWVAERVRQHQGANGEILEQQLPNDRWLMIIEHRTPSGYIVGNRVDITELKHTSELLRQRVAYQRATLDNLPFFFWLKDTQGRFLAVNKLFANSYGFDNPDALIGLTDFDICSKPNAERYLRDDLEVMASLQSKSMEEAHESSDGTRWAEVFKKPVIGDQGEVFGTVGFTRDVTERKRMMHALTQSEQRWSLAIQGANDGIWDWDVAAQTLYFSDRWKSMLGYDVTELEGRLEEWKTRVHPDDFDRVMAELNRHIEGASPHYQCEYRLRTKNAGYKWVYDRGRALFGAQGQPLRMAGSLTDISDRRAAEASARDRAEQLNGIFSLSPDGFVSFDHAHRVKYANPAFIRMTDLTESDLIGLDEDAFSDRLAQLCKANARFPRIATLRSSSRAVAGHDPITDHREPEDVGQAFELANTLQTVLEVRLRTSSAETVSQILYFRDVTKEVEVDRMKSEFLSTAAHELRTPMSSIFGFSELLLSVDFDEAERREYLGIIHRQTGLMTTILNELLDLARIEARRGKDFNLVEIDVRELVDEVVEGYQPPTGRNRPEKSSERHPIWICADHGKLIQAVMNVLSNAYKYSPQGGDVAVRLIDESDVTDREQVGIRITDEGMGMSHEQSAHVFERFYRADTSGKIPGTGLGMSIVKEIVELHGGHVALASTLGKGTEVTLWLPVSGRKPLVD